MLRNKCKNLTEEELFKSARRKDAHWYLLALLLIILGFYAFPLFSVASMLPVGTICLWAAGIARKGKLEADLLIEAKPEIERLKTKGLSEHQAMLKCGIDKFYYSPFWAVR